MIIPDDDCEVLTMTVSQAREVTFGNESQLSRVVNAIDKAQADVFAGTKERTYLVIEIEEEP